MRNSTRLRFVALSSVLAMVPLQPETLTHRGARRSSVRSIATDPHLTADELWTTSHPCQTCHLPEWACEFSWRSPWTICLRTAASSDLEQLRGRVPEEDQVVERLEPMGFQALALEQLTLAEKARLFVQSFEAVIGPTGACVGHSGIWSLARSSLS